VGAALTPRGATSLAASDSGNVAARVPAAYARVFRRGIKRLCDVDDLSGTGGMPLAACLAVVSIETAMALVTENLQPPVDPEPSVPSDESIRKAQALREALRRKFLSRPEPPANPYWAVGAD
jgi:hypothetical protein